MVVSCISLLVGGILIFQVGAAAALAGHAYVCLWHGCACGTILCRLLGLLTAAPLLMRLPTTHPPTRLVPVPPAAQGWRLDPLLLFGQLMTTGAAVSFAIEALRLRSEMYESEVRWMILGAVLIVGACFWRDGRAGQLTLGCVAMQRERGGCQDSGSSCEAAGTDRRMRVVSGCDAPGQQDV